MTTDAWIEAGISATGIFADLNGYTFRYEGGESEFSWLGRDPEGKEFVFTGAQAPRIAVNGTETEVLPRTWGTVTTLSSPGLHLLTVAPGSLSTSQTADGSTHAHAVDERGHDIALVCNPFGFVSKKTVTAGDEVIGELELTNVTTSGATSGVQLINTTDSYMGSDI